MVLKMIKTKQQKGMKESRHLISGPTPATLPRDLNWLQCFGLLKRNKTNKHTQTPSNMLTGWGAYWLWDWKSKCRTAIRVIWFKAYGQINRWSCPGRETFCSFATCCGICGCWSDGRRLNAGPSRDGWGHGASSVRAEVTVSSFFMFHLICGSLSEFIRI